MIIVPVRITFGIRHGDATLERPMKFSELPRGGDMIPLGPNSNIRVAFVMWELDADGVCQPVLHHHVSSPDLGPDWYQAHDSRWERI